MLSRILEIYPADPTATVNQIYQRITNSSFISNTKGVRSKYANKNYTT